MKLAYVSSMMIKYNNLQTHVHGRCHRFPLHTILIFGILLRIAFNLWVEKINDFCRHDLEDNYEIETKSIPFDMIGSGL